MECMERAQRDTLQVLWCRYRSAVRCRGSCRIHQPRTSISSWNIASTVYSATYLIVLIHARQKLHWFKLRVTCKDVYAVSTARFHCILLRFTASVVNKLHRNHDCRAHCGAISTLTVNSLRRRCGCKPTAHCNKTRPYRPSEQAPPPSWAPPSMTSYGQIYYSWPRY